MSAIALHPENISTADITHVYNSEVILDANNPVTGCNAEKVLQIKDRSIWYPCGTLIVPEQPDPDFLEYVYSFGKETDVVVPAGVNPKALSIMDGRDDPDFKAAVSTGKWVESYVVRPEVRQLVEANGGTYFVNQADDASDRANNKARYKQLMEGIVDVPEGEVAEGIDAIVAAVQRRLQKDQKAFVRHTASGGGYGNRQFDLAKTGPRTTEQVKKILEGEQPELWQDGVALVEKYLTLQHSPASSFNNGHFTYDNLQITSGSEYCGSWSPVPTEVCPADELKDIGNKTAQRLQAEGYFGPGNNDLATLTDGGRVGMEVNARMTGVRHAIEIGEMLLNTAWRNWRRAGHVIKTLDHFELKGEMSFAELHATLGRAGLLATAKSPYGLVITIPPHGKIAGIQAQEQGYKKTEGLYQEAVQLVGAADGNQHDNPYIPR